MPVINIKNLNKKFGANEVLRDINLTVDKGEVVAIIGPSGSGKSTILNILTKLLEPTSGEVNIKGNIGYMFQRDHLLEWRNIMDNITIGLEIQHQKTPQAISKIENLLKNYMK